MQKFIDKKSSSGIYNTRIGIYNGTKSLFTNYNPANGDVFGEDLPEGKDDSGFTMYGRWVPKDKVEWLDERKVS